MKLTYINKIAALLLFSTALVAGCSKDRSNEGITPVNQIGLSDPLTAAVITVFKGSTLSLKPAMSQSMSDKMDQLEFEWTAYDNSPTQSYVVAEPVIGKAFELNYAISNDDTNFTLGQNYLIRLTVKDKVTGISSFINYRILIGNKYGVGWVVLEDKSGVGELSFVFPDNTVEHNIYTDRNTTPIVGPKKIEITPFGITDGMSDAGKRMYILAQNGSQEYNYLTMVKKFDYNFEFFNPPAVQRPEFMNWMSASTNVGTARSGNLGIVINNGKAHSNLVGGFPGVKKWGDIALNPQGNTNYSLAPFAAGGPTFASIVYDNTSKRFYRIQAFNPSPVAGSLEIFPSSADAGVSDLFDMNNVGMTMVFQDSSDVVHKYNAIMRNANNKPHLLQFRTQNTTAAPKITMLSQEMTGSDILTANAITASSNTPHIYYGIGNVISRYETSSNTTQNNLYSFPAGEQITTMKYAKTTINNGGSLLVVATWNGTQGKLYNFSINSSGAIGSFTRQFSGFARIVDVAYKY